MEQRQKETLNETNMFSAAKKKEEKKGVNDDAAIEKRFEEWMVDYGKVYKDAAEKNKRFQIFKRKLEYFESFNASHKGCVVGPNYYSDLNKDEVPPFIGELPYEIPSDHGGTIWTEGPPPPIPRLRPSFTDYMDRTVKPVSSSFNNSKMRTLKELILPIMSRIGRK